MSLAKKKMVDLYTVMLRIRNFEEKIEAAKRSRPNELSTRR